MSAYFIKATEFPMTVIYGDTPQGERKLKNLERGEVFEFDGWLHHAEQTPNTEGPSDNAMAGSGYVTAPTNPIFLEALENLNKPAVVEPTVEVVAEFSPIDLTKEPEVDLEAELSAILTTVISSDVVTEAPTQEVKEEAAPAPVEEVKPAPKKRGPKPKAKVETPTE